MLWHVMGSQERNCNVWHYAYGKYGFDLWRLSSKKLGLMCEGRQQNKSKCCEEVWESGAVEAEYSSVRTKRQFECGAET
jgi:hypothetical protein